MQLSKWRFYSHCPFAALYAKSIAFNDTLLAWQDTQKHCWSVKEMDCSGISYKEITSPHIEFHIVSEALSSMSVYHNYPLLLLWQVLENEKQTSLSVY